MSANANRRPDGPPVAASRPRQQRVLVIVGLFAMAVVASALVGWRFARESTPVAGPILLISIDPLRADRLVAYGGRAGATPNLDRLAAGATVFTRAYSHAASSLPAHASLLTGRLPFDHGVRDDVGFALDGDAETLASRLADRGFTTGAAVSTYLLRADTGLGTGFAHYDAERPPAAIGALVPPVERDSAATARAASAWLDEQDSTRFFYALQLNGTPASLAAADGRATLQNVETVALAAADAAVGSVLDTLRRKGWYDDALVMVTAAHGGPPDGGDDPGRGFTLADPVRRVPLVVKMPGATGTQRIDTPLQHVDVTPTVLDLVRAPGDSGLRGRSFRGLLEGDDDHPVDAEAYAEAMSGALRFGWSELVEPGDEVDRWSVAAVTPAVASDAERDALALLGEVAPTLLPQPRAASAERRDPRTMGRVLAAYRLAARRDADRALAEAIGAYRQVVASLPDDANAWQRIGLASARLGRTADALDAFARVDALHPGLGEGALEAARVEFEAGHIDRAATGLAALLETLAPDASAHTSAAAHDLLASIAAARRRPDEARAQAALADKAEPGVPHSRFLDARLLHDQERCDEAMTGFDEVVTALDGRPSPFDGLHWRRGDCLARLDRHPEALEAFARAVTESPFDVRGYTSLATLQHAMNRHADAVATVERLVRSVPTPAGYATAVRLWTLIGERARGASLRATARERFSGEPGLRLLGR
jgi:tetratricopeptide (TPR) repeat protein